MSAKDRDAKEAPESERTTDMKIIVESTPATATASTPKVNPVFAGVPRWSFPRQVGVRGKAYVDGSQPQGGLASPSIAPIFTGYYG